MRILRRGVRLSVGLMIIIVGLGLSRMLPMFRRARLRKFLTFSRLNGYSSLLSACSLEIIDHFVSRGSHFVECVLLGEEGQGVPAFKIIGVFST